MLQLNNSILKTPDGSILLKGIRFTIKAGDLIYLSGPNGIGKTSLIKAILGLGGLKVTDLSNSFKSHAYLPQIENKDFLLPVRISDISAAGEYLTEEERETPWNRASGGQRKKALIEKTLSKKVELYILDEPYNHLDLDTIKKVNANIQKLIQQGSAVILVAHKTPEIDESLIIHMDAKQWK